MSADLPPRTIKTPELLVLSILSAATHFWRLFTPNAVVFDEQYYKQFAGHYLAGTHYVDVHPPLAKLLYAGIAKLAGVSAATLLGPDPVPVLRVVPALCGAVIIPLVYVLLRQLGAARRVATLGAFIILCDNALLADSRFALVEPVMIAAGLSAIVWFFAARSTDGWKRWALLSISGMKAGAAVAAKWTGASALALILAVWAWDAWRSHRRDSRTIGEGALLVTLPILVYVVTFALHFALLPKAGTEMAAMSPRFQATLVGSPNYDPAARMSFAAKFAELHRVMRRGNTTLIGVSHPAASPWYTWPIMKHPILLWQSVESSERQSNILLLGNPLVWWGALVAGALVMFALAARRPEGVYRFPLAVLGGGFLINFVPFIAIQRTMYLYHYLFALIFLVAFATYGMAVLAGWQERPDARLFEFPSRRSAVSYWTAAALILAAFLYFLPLTYGWPLTQAAFDRRFWVLHPF